MGTVLDSFHLVLRRWFALTYGAPTPPQEEGWPLIEAGKNTLLLAPTGSGKTLAAFYKCLDILYKSPERLTTPGVRVLYVSPLKALNNDIHKNLQLPLAGIAQTGKELGMMMPEVTAAVRTGDTPPAERQRQRRKPPHILITTPESLFLLLSSQARAILQTVQYVVVDEIHTLFATKRGCHLAVSLERLQNLVGERPLCRIGLSATVKPLEEVGKFLVGGSGECVLVDTGQRKDYDLQITLPAANFNRLPEKSVWPALHEKLYELVRAHRSTLVFVNNRRQAERLAVSLNELAGKEIARTHHGSLARELRLENEDLLKEGRLPCIVATSSLELGIDVGYIDLVVQVESPQEVAQGIQRIGRAGHIVGLPSKARLIPKTRLDLVECLVMAAAVKEGAIEPAQAPQNCLDVLAQQLVAMTTEGDWTPAEMYALCRRAYNYSTLDWASFSRVLAMLAGVYESDVAIDLKPRLRWDRLSDRVSADPYGRRLVYTNVGTIPNRGYYGVYLGIDGPRLGELDEEFVYERRLGERFLLGTSVWRIEELRQDRVIVSKAQSGGPNVPFWKGETVGRSFAFGARLGAFLGRAEGCLAKEEAFAEWLECELGVDDRAVVANLYSLLSGQQQSTGHLPSDICLVQEEFLDEMGNWHICLHSPYGRKLHLLLALLVTEQIERNYGFIPEAMPTDNGILFHAPGGAEPPSIDWAGLLTPDLRARVADLVSGTSLFGITFRHAAQRSLVMALLAYGNKRTPLWLSRLKATDLLQVVSRLPDFPLVMETYREILQDYFSLDDLEEFLGGLAQGGIAVHRVRTAAPSLFAHEHLFNFVGTQMYDDGAPAATDKKLFGLKQGTLAHLFGSEGFMPRLNDDALRAVEARLQGRDALAYGITLEKVQYWLERVGDISREEVDDYFPHAPALLTHFQELVERGKAFVDSRGLFVAALHGADYSEPLNSSGSRRHPLDDPEAIPVHAVTPGIPCSCLEPVIKRYLKYRGPFSANTLAMRYSLREVQVEEVLGRLEQEGLVSRLTLQTGERLWCSPQVLQEVHSRSLSKERKDSETVDRQQFALFLARHHELDLGEPCREEPLGGENAQKLQRVLHKLRERWLPASKLESIILPARLSPYSPAVLDQVLGSGLLAWRSRQVGREIFLRFEPGLTEEPRALPSWLDCPSSMEDFTQGADLSDTAESLLTALADRGALNLIELNRLLGKGLFALWQGLTELILAGLVSNDTLGPLRIMQADLRASPAGLRTLVDSSVLGQMGRFFLLPPVHEITAYSKISVLLDRYGIIDRETAGRENMVWGELYPILDYLENMGEVKRGYFVDGLGGIQFAAPQALLELKRQASGDRRWVLCSDDPAYPAQLSDERMAGAAYVVFEKGRPLLSVKKRRLSLTILEPLETSKLTTVLRHLLRALYPLYPSEKIVVADVDGVPAARCAELAALEELGFEVDSGEVVLWPSRRPRLVQGAGK